MARALDVVGDRWALLVVRELLLGPRRYTDLLEGLPGVGTNVLSTRLRELEEAGIIERHRLRAPTPVTVYDLTDDGRDLRPVVDALGRWGARLLTIPSDSETTAPRWLASSIAATLPTGAFADGTHFELHIDDEAFTLDVHERLVSVRHGAADHPSATLTGSLQDFFATAKGRTARRRRPTVGGDGVAGSRFVNAMKGCLA